MSRTTPVNSGYAIISGQGTGTNGSRIDVWVEYKVISQDYSKNTSDIRAYFYAALASGQTSSTALGYGLSSTFSVDGNSGASWVNVGYDFTEPGVPCVTSSDVDDEGVTKNYLGSFVGTITHDTDGKKSVAISGSFTTQSSYISGGSIDTIIDLPRINKDPVVYIFVPENVGDTIAAEVQDDALVATGDATANVSSENALVVTGNALALARNGVIRVASGGTACRYSVYLFETVTTAAKYMPYIYDGSKWVRYSDNMTY